MKALTSLSLAATLLLGSTAFAQDSTPSPSDQSSPSPMQTNPPTSPGSTAGSSTAADSSSTKQTVAQACQQQAKYQKLTGADKTKFMKDCKAGKTTRTPQ